MEKLREVPLGNQRPSDEPPVIDWNGEQRKRLQAALDDIYGGDNPHSDLPASAQHPASETQGPTPPNKYNQANDAARKRHEEKVNEGLQQNRKKAKDALRKTGRRL